MVQLDCGSNVNGGGEWSGPSSRGNYLRFIVAEAAGTLLSQMRLFGFDSSLPIEYFFFGKKKLRLT